VAKSGIIEEIIIELRKKGLEIRADAMSDLKSARTLMKLEKATGKGMGETEPKIDKYLRNVEAYVISEADKLLLPEKVQKWLTALDIASCDSCVAVKEPKEEMRMIPGVPRDQKWIRVEPIGSLPIEKLEQMATDSKLGFRKDNDGHLIVHGAEETVKEFIKKMSFPNGKPTEKKR
jgi:hypothetical protein